MKRLALATLVAACGGGGGTTSPDARPDDFDRQAMLSNLASSVILPGIERFDARADALAEAIGAGCDAGARQAWRDAMIAWQEIDVVRVGPAMEGGLRDALYSWPVVSSCAVDQEVMAYRAAPEGYDLSTKLTNRRGLPALEYLLFAPTLETTCPPEAAPPGWSELSDADRRAARCAFAAVAAADLAAHAQELVDSWAPGGGGFATTLAQAGAPGSPFASAHEGVNRVSDGLFVLDTDVKDMKLAEPAGITVNSCGTLGAPCPQELESPWSDHGKQNILANLRGFEAIFLGGEGIGFDDFLSARGAPELAASVDADVTAAIAAVEAIPGTLGEAIVSYPEEVAAAHAAVKRITDTLKSQFLTVLALELPEDLGDDGD